MSLPQYLERPRDNVQTFGELTYEAGNRWVIEGEPQVVQLAKRLFPGSEGRGAGMAKFPATRRTFGDLVWLMQRWPLRVAEQSLSRWEADYQATCEYVVARDAFNSKPRQDNPGVLFNGQLRPYQQEALAWCQHNQRTLIADEMGLGKTVEALAWAATAGLWPVLIVPQPHLIVQWEAMVKAFLSLADPGMPLFAANDLTMTTLRGRKAHSLVNSGADLFLCHYLLLADWREALVEVNPKLVIFDEIQELRRRESLKYSAAHHIAQEAESVIGMSGTPVYNRGGEIWNILNVIEMHCLGDWDSFTREWCTGYGSDTVAEPEILGQHLCREGLMLRRTKAEVMKDLPEKSRIVQVLDHDDKAFTALLGEAVKLAKAAANEADVLKRGRTEREAIQETRKATGIAKTKEAVAFISGLIEAGEPPLVFAHHHAVVDGLIAGLKKYNPVVISGRETPKQKQESKRAFIAGESQVCIISMRSAAGLDGFQQRARTVVFVELDWSPAVHSQGEDRLHRDGQQDSVVAYYLVIEDGTDPDVQEALGLKVAQSTGIMGDSKEDPALVESRAREHMQKVLERLRKRAA